MPKCDVTGEDTHVVEIVKMGGGRVYWVAPFVKTMLVMGGSVEEVVVAFKQFKEKFGKMGLIETDEFFKNSYLEEKKRAADKV